MKSFLYPLILEPLLAERLGTLVDAPGSWPHNSILMAGESSRVATGPQAGCSLNQLRHLWGADLVGPSLAGEPLSPLPLELRLTRSAERLLPVSLSEDSLWYLLDAPEDSSLHAGYLKGLDFEQVAAGAGRDPGRWAEHMPRYLLERGSCLFLPQRAPLVLGPGLSVAQIGRPAQALSPWPLGGDGPEALELARLSASPFWPGFKNLDSVSVEIFHTETLRLLLRTGPEYLGHCSPDALTFIWPIAGQGRLRCRGPAPAVRLAPGRVLMLPAALGGYSVESSSQISYLHIEAGLSCGGRP